MKELIPTEELIRELLGRFDHAVFMGIHVLKEAKKEGDISDIVSKRNWFGNSYVCCGLCESLKKAILDECNSKETQEESF